MTYHPAGQEPRVQHIKKEMICLIQLKCVKNNSNKVIGDFKKIIICFLLFAIMLFDNNIIIHAMGKTEIQNMMIKTLYNNSGGMISCDFDGYRTTSGRHEGIDFSNKSGVVIYSLCSGTVIRTNNPSSGLSTLSIYDSNNNMSIIYLHSTGFKVKVGDKVSQGQPIAVEGAKGATSAHTHVEVRKGKRGYASKSVNDYVLENENPYSYWEKIFSVDYTNSKLEKPCSPSITKASTSKNSVTISWNKVDNIEAYRVDRRPAGSNTKYKTIETLNSSATSFTDKNLTAGAHYYYRVYAKNSAGWSEKQDGYSVYMIPEATTIKSVTAENTSKLTVKWSKVSGASSYLVTRRKSGTEGYNEVKTVTDTSFTDTGLDAGTGYWYKVYAVNPGGKSEASENSYGMTKCAAPKITASGANGLTIKWNTVVGKVSAYQYALYRKGPSDSSFNKITTLTSTQYTDTGLLNGNKYSYKIVVLEKDSGTQATYSDESSATTISVPKAPVIKISNQDENSIGVSWEAVTYAEKYQVYRKAEGESAYQLTSTVASTSYTDKKVESGKKYTYCVRAVNAAGSSGNSNELSLYAVLSAPTGVSCTVKSATSIEVTWNAVNGADGYLVRRRKDGDSDYEVIAAYVDSNTRSFTDTGLLPSTKYYYKIRTWTGTQLSAVSDYGKATTSASDSQTLESPLVKVQAQDTTTMNVSWSSVSGATKYEVYRRLAGESYSDTPTYTTASTSLVDKNLKAGTRYWYRVYAVNSNKKSPKPNGIMCYTYPDQPAVTVETVSMSSLKASWNSVKNASYYILNIRKSGDESYETVTTTESTSYVVGNLEAGTTYYFRVYAVITDRESYITKLTSEKPAGVGGTTKYNPATCAHNYGAWTVTKQATCTENGSRYHICSKCNNKETEQIKATGHNYASSWTIIQNATCEEEGIKCHVCQTCGERSDITAIPATGHNYENTWITEKEASCTEDGLKYRQCSVCADKDYEIIPAKGHHFEVVNRVEPTVETEGYVEYKCENCDETYKELINKLSYIELTDVVLNEHEIVINQLGESAQLMVDIAPEDATDKNVNWYSEDDNIAGVDEHGVVTAVSYGETVVYVETLDGGFVDYCKVVVDKKENSEDTDNKENDESGKDGDVPKTETDKEERENDESGKDGDAPKTETDKEERGNDESGKEGTPKTETDIENKKDESGKEGTDKTPVSEKEKQTVIAIDDAGKEGIDGSDNDAKDIGDSLFTSSGKYQVTMTGEEPEVSFTGTTDKEMTKIMVPDTVSVDGITYIVTSVSKEAFKNNRNLKSVTIGKNVEIIEESAFYGCSSLTKVVFRSHEIERIGDNAFANCYTLTSVTIPDGVEKIGKNAFAGCRKLKKVIIKTTVLTKIGKNAFKGIKKKATFKCPKKQYKKYKKLLKKSKIAKTVKIK